MKNVEDQKLLADLVKKAESGEHTRFTWICSWSEYRSHQTSKRALKMLVNSLEYSTASLFNEYCKAIPNGTADITNLLVRNVLLQTTEFYKLELAMIEDMLDEYEAYLFESFNNLLGQFLFYEIRPFSECWDRRNMDNGF
jgi:hypothetical protein